MSSCASCDFKAAADQFGGLLETQRNCQVEALEMNCAVCWESEGAAGSAQRPRKGNQVHGGARLAEPLRLCGDHAGLARVIEQAARIDAKTALSATCERLESLAARPAISPTLTRRSEAWSFPDLLADC